MGIHGKRERQCAEVLVALLLAAKAAGTGAWSMLQVCLFDIALDTFFLSKMSSRSGEERSGRKGTNTGALAGLPLDFFVGLACLGCGACNEPVVLVEGAARVAGDGSGIG